MTYRKSVRWIIGLSLVINALIFVLVVVSCGGRNDGGQEDKPVVQAPQKPKPGDDKDWLAVKPLFDKDCVKCHDGAKQKPDLRTRDAVLASHALLKLKANQMPPDGKIDPAEKGRMISYLGHVQ